MSQTSMVILLIAIFLSAVFCGLTRYFLLSEKQSEYKIFGKAKEPARQRLLTKEINRDVREVRRDVTDANR